ncbi:LytR C-terminal domain-containing protein [Candidatus Dojkabacteria bacterium]|nr:LytR C-terminal domain-containing protein [Candidatus Dojkabacteria bacterium]
MSKKISKLSQKRKKETQRSWKSWLNFGGSKNSQKRKKKNSSSKRLKNKRVSDKKLEKKKNPISVTRILSVFAIFTAVFIVLLIVKSFYERIKKLDDIEVSHIDVQGFKDSDKNSKYDSTKPFSLLIVYEESFDYPRTIDGFLIANFDPESSSVTLITIPSSLYMYISEYDEYTECSSDVDLVRIKDLMMVGDLETPRRSLSFSFYQLEELIGYSFDGVVIVDKDFVSRFESKNTDIDDASEVSGSYEEWSEKWFEYWYSLFNEINVFSLSNNASAISGIQSNMSAADLYKFAKKIQSIKDENLKKVVFSDDLLQEVVNEKGEMVNYVSLSAVDDLFTDVSVDIQMDKEQARIEVFNATSVDGLGSRYARLIDHMGGDVIRIDNAGDDIGKTVIYTTDKEKFYYSIEKIKSLWEHDIVVIEGRPDFITTGDIIVVLGSDD